MNKKYIGRKQKRNPETHPFEFENGWEGACWPWPMVENPKGAAQALLPLLEGPQTETTAILRSA